MVSPLLVETLDGRRGTLTTRYRIEWVAAGAGYQAGIGGWKVARGHPGVGGEARFGSIAGAAPGAAARRAWSRFRRARAVHAAPALNRRSYPPVAGAA
jgi:hypothetical protein